MSEVWVDTDHMGTVIPQVEHLSDQTKGVHTGLVGQLAPLSNAAGTDDAAAKAFYESYNPTRDMVLGALLDFCTIADGMVTGIHTMVRGYESTEENNTVPHFGSDNPPPDKPGGHTKP
ncbi:hypothetical protein ABIA35_006345 [Catenulispora sp. MAP12-49]|jgi:hypothetical protein|uniref:WXG100 family type VII secretion target n=1 Tax=unclassified Catenulispora TaxID=414885 RepID=UPI00351319AE